ncbi:Acetyltransferase (GNAT) family protein [Paractinoplanes atraurantiacus]|uniref:Acetyltransferase (GNAT) family protein n=1 Tax=Paractinoplanes atraurantiacus TaxID=1036182 RepID=A0A285F346_9ACTN|nr:Acetyltransferase (GNAT) family protein [Actinoplanes atraurantiacus]
MRVEPLGGAVETAYEIARVCQEHDQPDIPFSTLEGYRVAQANGWPGYTYERSLGLLDGKPVGLMELDMSQDDNLDTVNIGIAVLPSARRHGVGRALWEAAVARTHALGRRHLIGPTVQRHPDGGAFATAMGATAGLEEIRSRLDIRTLDQAHLDGLLAEARARAGGYELVRWTGVAPDEIIDDVAYLQGRLVGDAPVGDLAWEAEKVDADRIREDERSRLRRGRTSYHAGALHAGRLVAVTTIAVENEKPAQVWQNITLVDPEHRGHRLGLLVKLENLRHVRENEPRAEVIDTFNAASNEHMLRVNRAMGFQPVESTIQWQKTVA